VDTPNIFSLMNAAGPTWRVYAEDMPSPCFGGDRNGHLRRHNPAVYYRNIGSRGDGTCAQYDLSLDVASDLAHGTLPAFSFVVPNQYRDMHTVSSAASARQGLPTTRPAITTA
jgi:acid phosphatase